MALYKSQMYAPIRPTARLHPLYAALVPLVALLVMVLSQIMVMLPGSVLVAQAPTGQGISTQSWQMLYFLIIGFGAVLIAVLAWVKWVENRSLASMGWRFERAGFRYGRGFAIGLAMNIGALLAIGLLGGYEMGQWWRGLVDPMALLLIGLFLLGFIIQGGTEEVLVRGWMLSTMAARWGLPIAVGVTSSLFAVLHLPNEWPHVNWIAMLNIVLIGGFFCLYAYKERSLLGVCAVHSAWNWIMSIGFGLNVSGNQLEVTHLVVALQQDEAVANWITGGTFGPEGSFMVTLSILLASGLIWRWRGEDAAPPTTDQELEH